ncbi:hypothetical protein Q5752_004034 [Cryptotrichosporon argae]
MDGLIAEINKRKAEDSSVGGAKKYMRRADVERAREEEERRRRDEARRAKEAEARGKEEARGVRLLKEAEARRTRPSSPSTSTSTPEPSERAALPLPEVTRRLRAKGQPVRLFGETEPEVRARLRALELADERSGAAQNDFKRAAEERERLEREKEARIRMEQEAGMRVVQEAQDEVKERKKEERREVELLDMDLVRRDINKVHPIIYWALKNLLKEWEESLDARPDAEKQTAAGKLAATNQVQSAHNMKPLFKQLRQRTLAEDVVRHLAEIVHHIQLRNYQSANDAYLRLSIGNAAWPIGVVSVGMHERSSDQKIYQNVAHVLNDEVSRKYIQAVKRLMTFAQAVRPPFSMAQFMG